MFTGIHFACPMCGQGTTLDISFPHLPCLRQLMVHHCMDQASWHVDFGEFCLYLPTPPPTLPPLPVAVGILGLKTDTTMSAFSWLLGIRTPILILYAKYLTLGSISLVPTKLLTDTYMPYLGGLLQWGSQTQMYHINNQCNQKSELREIGHRVWQRSLGKAETSTWP